MTIEELKQKAAHLRMPVVLHRAGIDRWRWYNAQRPEGSPTRVELTEEEKEAIANAIQQLTP